MLGGPGTFKTKTAAKTARSDARKRLGGPGCDVTVADFRTRWTTDPLFARPKDSTNIHNRRNVLINVSHELGREGWPAQA